MSAVAGASPIGNRCFVVLFLGVYGSSPGHLTPHQCLHGMDKAGLWVVFDKLLVTQQTSPPPGFRFESL